MIGGCSAAALFLLFPVIDHFRVALYALVLAIGFFVGLEIPLLMRILKGYRFPRGRVERADLRLCRRAGRVSALSAAS